MLRLLHMKIGNGKLGPGSIIVGVYVPSDILKRSTYYANPRKAKIEVRGLADKLVVDDGAGIIINNDHFDRLYPNSREDYSLKIGFSYKDRRDAKETFLKIQNNGLLLRCNPLNSTISPMVSRVEIDEDLDYNLLDVSRDTLRWMLGIFRNITIIGVNGSNPLNGDEYLLNTGFFGSKAKLKS